jgi:hypothetical protein
MLQLRVEIRAELTTLIIRFRRTMSFVSICLELLAWSIGKLYSYVC